MSRFCLEISRFCLDRLGLVQAPAVCFSLYVIGRGAHNRRGTRCRVRAAARPEPPTSPEPPDLPPQLRCAAGTLSGCELHRDGIRTGPNWGRGLRRPLARLRRRAPEDGASATPRLPFELSSGRAESRFALPGGPPSLVTVLGLQGRSPQSFAEQSRTAGRRPV